ncbi:hypothetical protein, variant [Verruconis gallopava]|uniref:Zn(2)-C6 fungal-type domain-containing protein n=1 Tax=Verruconis gallopava TaxID=253628 RepID=A0A0D2B1M9_9PEZI|nr:uncharacterized protein PV09_03784 [Verruconis gallopava]XP_016215119.1 hypothetical protein, variant [Verruconis gallopava]KIW05249.1 hypothetical protein PV09_03784 [Verruconis gallopava]KIW05250.1 hypothetical protein, variant [Verruconis gallopava]
MSQGPPEAAATPSEAPTQMGGQVRPVETEGTMSGFTAVNGRGSPPTPVPKTSATDGSREQVSLPPRELSHRSAVEGELPQQHANEPEHDMNTSPTNGHHKRKRSTSDVDEARSSGGSERSSITPTHEAPEAQMQDATAYSRSATGNADSQWNPQQPDEQAEQLRMLAPIQRENQQYNHDGYTPAQNSQSSNGLRPGYRKDEATGLITTNAGVQMDPKKRKRAFTNRTKTGCQTCRRRKKKCDEAKPECNNCTRGGFKCEGYTPKVSWPPENKMKSNKQPLPPNSHVQPTSRDLQEFSGNLHPRPTPRTDSQQYMDMSTPIQPNMRSRAITVDDDSDRTVTNGWPNSPYATSHRGYGNDKDPVHGLPMHNNSMAMRDSYDRPLSSMSSSGMHNMSSSHGMQPSPGIIHTAQQALRNTPQQMNPMTGFNGVPHMSSERQKMHAGELYSPFCTELEEDRERCAKALYTFNNNNHASRAERMRHFRNVLTPDSPHSAGPVRVGKDATVDVPFRCEYGYNITLGKDVVIEGGCHISDPRPVHIDNGSYIGPGVKIMGKVLPFDPATRAGAAMDGKARAFEIHIGKNVHIGANSVVQPEEDMITNGRLEIGDGAYIKPNSVVNKSVPPYVIYGPRGPACDVLSGVVSHAPSNEERKGRMMR